MFSIDELICEPITPVDVLNKNQQDQRNQFEVFVLKKQKEIIDCLRKIETDYTKIVDSPKKVDFKVDRWLRAEGGGGVSCVIQDSNVFEKAGVNVSAVNGQLSEQSAQQMRSRGRPLSKDTKLTFSAVGISSVIHPRNPHVPTIHFNYRYFEVHDPKTDELSSWFGGGTDLTPYILDEQDCIHFHQSLKNACDQHNLEYYPKFKKWCDDYFCVTHRNERRGVGGIFFDDLDSEEKEKTFKFIQGCANAILPGYEPIVRKNYLKEYTEQDREWQLLRRGR